MNQYKSISELKDFAKEKLSGRFSGAIFASLVPQLVTFAISFMATTVVSMITAITLLIPGVQNSAASVSNAFQSPGIVQIILIYLLTQVVSVIAGVFNTGLALYFLNLASGRLATSANLFYGFQYLFKKSLTISLVNVLVNTVCLMPYNIFHSLFTNDFSGRWILPAVIALVCGMIIYIPISLSLSQAHYLLLDFPRHSAGEVIRLSIRIMKGKKRRLFLLELSFLPLLLLGLLSLGIGELWIMPYMNMTLALYFLDIMKPVPEQAQDHAAQEE